jgi:hypothetical protein
MKESGSMINIMERELNNGIIIKSNIQEISLMAKKQVKENLSSMEMFTKETLSMVNSMEKENTYLLDQVKYTKEISLKTIFKDKVKLYGQMEQLMKEDF